MTASTLWVRGLNKHYGARQVVHDVSLRVDSGQVIGLSGPQRRRRDPVVYMIVGLAPSEAGGIDLDGVNTSRLPFGMRPQLT
jgi:lipopolysaccharide export system ATP-binding protein